MRYYSKRLLIILFFSLTVWFAWDFYQFTQTAIVPAKQTIDYVLKPGATIKTVARDLHQLGCLKRPGYLIILARSQGHSQHLQAGEYQFTGGMRAIDIIEQLAAGKVILRSVTLVEGWTFKQMLAALQSNVYLTHTLQQKSAEAIMNELGLPGLHPEGQFFPDTYRFTRGTSDIVILKRAHQKFVEVFSKEWSQRSSTVPYKNSLEALIVASMIEKETRLAIERPIIADVILKRLAKGMLLQIDSTLVYGLGSHYQGSLHKADLRLDTPYNTYLHKGLPPTPIAMPSRASIHAALHPWPNAALYFVARGDGSQEFSATLQQHSHAVRKYITSKHTIIKTTKKTATASLPQAPLPLLKQPKPVNCVQDWYLGNIDVLNPCP